MSSSSSKPSARKAPAPIKGGKNTATKPDPTLRSLVLPESVSDSDIQGFVQQLDNKLKLQPDVISEKTPNFNIALREVGKKKKCAPEHKTRVVTRVVNLLGISKIGRYGNYNIDNDPNITNSPGDVSSTKFEVAIGYPRVEATETDRIMKENCGLLRNYLEAWDTANARALTDPSINVPFNKVEDHVTLKAINSAKSDEGYDWEQAVEKFLETAYRPREEGEKLFPISSIRRKKKENDDGTTTVSELMSFTKPAFPTIYGAQLEQAKKQSPDQRMAMWPDKFRGLEFYNPGLSKAPEPKTPNNTKYDELRIVDITGRTIEMFNARLKDDDRQDIRALLAHLNRSIPVSLGLEFRSYVSSPRTFHTKITFTDIVIAVPFEVLLVMLSAPTISRVVCDEEEIMAMSSCLDYLKAEEGPKDDDAEAEDAEETSHHEQDSQVPEEGDSPVANYEEEQEELEEEPEPPRKKSNSRAPGKNEKRKN